jgi:hypothetical protein
MIGEKIAVDFARVDQGSAKIEGYGQLPLDYGIVRDDGKGL